MKITLVRVTNYRINATSVTVTLAGYDEDVFERKGILKFEERTELQSEEVES